MPAVFLGRLFDLGYFRVPFGLGSAGLVITTLLIAECNQYWQFLLAQGILVGVCPVLFLSIRCISILIAVRSAHVRHMLWSTNRVDGALVQAATRPRCLLHGPGRTDWWSNFPCCGPPAHSEGRVGHSHLLF